jgi:hypothetical protein
VHYFRDDFADKMIIIDLIRLDRRENGARFFCKVKGVWIMLSHEEQERSENEKAFQPRECDIPFCRGGGVNKNPLAKFFRDLVKEGRPEYKRKGGNVEEQNSITDSIFQKLHQKKEASGGLIRWCP